MAEDRHNENSKLFESRVKHELELFEVQFSIQDAVQVSDRRVPVERLIRRCQKVSATPLKKRATFCVRWQNK